MSAVRKSTITPSFVKVITLLVVLGAAFWIAFAVIRQAPKNGLLRLFARLFAPTGAVIPVLLSMTVAVEEYLEVEVRLAVLLTTSSSNNRPKNEAACSHNTPIVLLWKSIPIVVQKLCIRS